jgi:Mg2+/Co2+ transporter CorB
VVCGLKKEAQAMVDSPLVKDVMVRTVQLEAKTSACEALQTLSQEEVENGVVYDEYGKLLGIITMGQLQIADTFETVQTLIKNTLCLEPIEIEDKFDIIVQVWADAFFSNQSLLGIVVQKQGTIQGILLRETIIEHALSTLSGRRLAGSPLGHTRSVLFECPIDHERKLVDIDYYDPSNPPTCSKGHKMRRVRD